MSTQTATKTIVEVFDPAMCCSTGVCGSDVDTALVDFANDVKWMKSEGIDIKRFNLGQEPEVFKMNPTVLTRLQKDGSECLPLIFINGKLVAEGGYPNREQLTEWISPSGSAESNQSSEMLSSLENAVFNGEKSELQTLFEKAKQNKIDMQQIVNAIQNGINKRQAVTQSMAETANELLGVSSNGCAPGSGCC